MLIFASVERGGDCVMNGLGSRIVYLDSDLFGVLRQLENFVDRLGFKAETGGYELCMFGQIFRHNFRSNKRLPYGLIDR